MRYRVLILVWLFTNPFVYYISKLTGSGSICILHIHLFIKRGTNDTCGLKKSVNNCIFIDMHFFFFNSVHLVYTVPYFVYIFFVPPSSPKCAWFAHQLCFCFSNELKIKNKNFFSFFINNLKSFEIYFSLPAL